MNNKNRKLFEAEKEEYHTILCVLLHSDEYTSDQDHLFLRNDEEIRPSSLFRENEKGLIYAAGIGNIDDTLDELMSEIEECLETDPASPYYEDEIAEIKIAHLFEVHYISATGVGLYQTFTTEEKSTKFIEECNRLKVKNILFEPDDEVTEEFRNDQLDDAGSEKHE